MRGNEGRERAPTMFPKKRRWRLRRWMLVFVVVCASGAAAIDPGSRALLSDLTGPVRRTWRDIVWKRDAAWDRAAVLPPSQPTEPVNAPAVTATSLVPQVPAPPVVAPPGRGEAAPPLVRASRPIRPAPSPVAIARPRSTDPAPAARFTSRSAGLYRAPEVARPPESVQASGVPDTAVASGKVEVLGRLFVHSVPWGTLYVDDRLIGNTPRVDLPVAPGLHRIRVLRPGFIQFDSTITILPGDSTRLTGITLRAVPP